MYTFLRVINVIGCLVAISGYIGVSIVNDDDKQGAAWVVPILVTLFAIFSGGWLKPGWSAIALVVAVFIQLICWNENEGLRYCMLFTGLAIALMSSTMMTYDNIWLSVGSLFCSVGLLNGATTLRAKFLRRIKAIPEQGDCEEEMGRKMQQCENDYIKLVAFLALVAVIICALCIIFI